jgi:transposase-like protein
MSKSSHKATLVKNHANPLIDLLGSDFKRVVKEGVEEYMQDLLRKLLDAWMQSEVEQLCGQRYSHIADRVCVRHGSQPGVVTALGTGKTTIMKPRVRNVKTKKEVKLDTYAAFGEKGLLNEKVLALVEAGVSTRELQRTIKKTLRNGGVSSSAISRTVANSAELALKHFEQRMWRNTAFVALLFDGVRLGNTLLLACIGIDSSGRKHVLGIHPGGSEQEVVCTKFVRKLIDRGLNPDGNYLFVIDGAKGLRNAIQNCFGQNALIQRCQEHKIRDVEGHLPFKLRSHIRTQLQAAYNTRSYAEASRRLQKVRSSLGRYEQAKNSLTEGLESSLTLHKLGIWGGLKDSLRTTNIIESTFSSLRQKTRNVTNWQNEPQAIRWAASGLLKIEERYRRVPGHRTLTRLRQKLDLHYSASQSPQP